MILILHRQVEAYYWFKSYVEFLKMYSYRFKILAFNFSWWRVSAANGFVRGRSMKIKPDIENTNYISNILPGEVGGVNRVLIFKFSRLVRSPFHRACKPGLAIPWPVNIIKYNGDFFLSIVQTYLWWFITNIVYMYIIFKFTRWHPVYWWYIS